MIFWTESPILLKLLIIKYIHYQIKTGKNIIKYYGVYTCTWRKIGTWQEQRKNKNYMYIVHLCIHVHACHNGNK